MKRFLWIFAFAATTVLAAPPQPKPAVPTAVAITQRNVTRTIPITNASCIKLNITPLNGPHGQVRFNILCNSGTGQPNWVQFNVDDGPYYPTYLWPAPSCGQKPAPASQHADCPNGTTGAGWTQTHDWTCSDGAWIATPWLPADPPPGVCTDVVPPPGGDIDLSYVDKTSARYARFKAWVDAHLVNQDYLQFATDFAYMAKLDGNAQYCAKAVSMTDAYVAKAEAAVTAGGQPNWGSDANGRDGFSSDSYLNVGVNIQDLAITKMWCASAMTPSMWPRWKAMGDQVLYNLWNPTLAKFGGRPYPWSGWAMTPKQPGNNYFYSFTKATQMWRWATGDTQWDDELAAAWASLDAYWATIATGGSEEGMGYGTAQKMLFEDYRFQRDLFGENHAGVHLKNTGDYWVWAITPDFLHFPSIGDQSRVSLPTMYDYQCAVLAQNRAMNPDAAVRARLSWELHHGVCQSFQNAFNFRDSLLDFGDAGTPPTALCYNGAATGDLFCRTSWTDPHALETFFKAGPYDQSHAHQDQGALQLYTNSGFLMVDLSALSHSGIEQGVENNGTIAFRNASGTLQRQVMNSTSTMTVTGTDPATGVRVVENLTPAAGPAVTSWTRTLTQTNRSIAINDVFTLITGYTATFQLPVPVQPTVNGNTITAGGLTATVVYPASPVITIVDMHAANSDYNAGAYRVDINGSATGYQVTLTAQ